MEEKPKKSSVFVLVLLSFLFFEAVMCLDSDEFPSLGPLVNKESRKVLSSSDSGLISALDVLDKYKGNYHLQFITMEPGSLFLPVLLHADMVFYVHTGKGTVTWVGDDGTDSLDVEKGDIYKLDEGTVFYVYSHPDPTREKLRIHAIFDTQEAFAGAYSNLSDLVRGFDDKVLQMSFKVSEEAIQTIKLVEKPPPIVPFEDENESDGSKNWEERLLKAIINGSKKPLDMIYNKKKKRSTRAFNLLTTKHDVENCNGWSVAVTRRDFRALRGCDIGVFMVNLTKGSMMGPHWNPRGTEIAIAIHGQGMVQVVCPSEVAGDEGTIQCENARFKVKEGDVFIVPRFHPMAQISFNNDSFVFVGFSSNAKKNYPQFLAGKWSVFRTIEKKILAMSFNVGNETTVEELLASQDDAVMLECASCAEEAERKMEEEIQRKREEEEEAKRREEEAKKRKEEEEEAKRREEQEQEAKMRKEEEEEAKRRKEEEEEAKRKEEEEQEQETKRTEEEEQEAKSREEEEGEEQEAKRREEDIEIEKKQKGEGNKKVLSRKMISRV